MKIQDKSLFIMFFYRYLQEYLRWNNITTVSKVTTSLLGHSLVIGIIRFVKKMQFSHIAYMAFLLNKPLLEILLDCLYQYHMTFQLHSYI